MTYNCQTRIDSQNEPSKEERHFPSPNCLFCWYWYIIYIQHSYIRKYIHYNYSNYSLPVQPYSTRQRVCVHSKHQPSVSRLLIKGIGRCETCHQNVWKTTFGPELPLSIAAISAHYLPLENNMGSLRGPPLWNTPRIIRLFNQYIKKSFQGVGADLLMIWE